MPNLTIYLEIQVPNRFTYYTVSRDLPIREIIRTNATIRAIIGPHQFYTPYKSLADLSIEFFIGETGK